MSADLPQGLPELPPNSRYAGTLGDFDGERLGHIWFPGRTEGWTGRNAWNGLKSEPDPRQSRWHFAEALRAEETTAPAEPAPQEQPPRQEGETPSLSDLGDANDSDSIVASCNCFTKTPDIQFHKRGCKYRLIEERNAAERRAAGAEALLREFVRRWDRNGFYDISHEDLAEQARKLLKP